MLCTRAYHLSKRTTQAVLKDLFGVLLGLGTIANPEQATTRAVAEPVAAARGRAVAEGGPTLWRAKDRRDVLRPPQARASIATIRAACWSRPSQRCRGAYHSAKHALGQGQLWDP
jgi:hypothetical protein